MSEGAWEREGIGTMGRKWRDAVPRSTVKRGEASVRSSVARRAFYSYVNFTFDVFMFYVRTYTRIGTYYVLRTTYSYHERVRCAVLYRC